MKSIDSDTGACDCARGNAERGMACTAARGVSTRCSSETGSVQKRWQLHPGANAHGGDNVGGEVRMRGDCVCVRARV